MASAQDELDSRELHQRLGALKQRLHSPSVIPGSASAGLPSSATQATNASGPRRTNTDRGHAGRQSLPASSSHTATTPQPPQPWRDQSRASEPAIRPVEVISRPVTHYSPPHPPPAPYHQTSSQSRYQSAAQPNRRAQSYSPPLPMPVAVATTVSAGGGHDRIESGNVGQGRIQLSNVHQGSYLPATYNRGPYAASSPVQQQFQSSTSSSYTATGSSEPQQQYPRTSYQPQPPPAVTGQHPHSPSYPGKGYDSQLQQSSQKSPSRYQLPQSNHPQNQGSSNYAEQRYPGSGDAGQGFNTLRASFASEAHRPLSHKEAALDYSPIQRPTASRRPPEVLAPDAETGYPSRNAIGEVRSRLNASANNITEMDLDLLWSDGRLGVSLDDSYLHGRPTVVVAEISLEGAGNHRSSLPYLAPGDYLALVNGIPVTGKNVGEVTEIILSQRKPMKLRFVLRRQRGASSPTELEPLRGASHPLVTKSTNVVGPVPGGDVSHFQVAAPNQVYATGLSDPHGYSPTFQTQPYTAYAAQQPASIPPSSNLGHFPYGVPQNEAPARLDVRQAPFPAPTPASRIERCAHPDHYEVLWNNPNAILGIVLKDDEYRRPYIRRITSATSQIGVERAQVGDYLMAIGGTAVNGMNTEACVQLLKSRPKPLLLEFKRAASQGQAADNRANHYVQPAAPGTLTTDALLAHSLQTSLDFQNERRGPYTRGF